MPDAAAASAFPLPLSAYADPAGSLFHVLASRIATDPFNAIATAIFILAIVHTFGATRLAALGHRLQARHDDRARAEGRPTMPSVPAEILHLLGEVEAVFGLWALVLLIAITAAKGWPIATHYFNESVNYTEPMFVVVIMTLASTRPIVTFAEAGLRRVASLGGGGAAAWWGTVLTIGPLLGSFITEPAAMTICALLLGRQFYGRNPSTRLKYATLGLLFVNVSIGGTLTHFAAPPVLIVARHWDWDTAFMFRHFGWRAIVAIGLSTAVYFVMFRRELIGLDPDGAVVDDETSDQEPHASRRVVLPVPVWVVAMHVLFVGWTVWTAHAPALFIGGFLFFLAFAKATAMYQSPLRLRSALLVGFFLAGLVIHGGLQTWWIAPALSGLAAGPLFISATVLTAFNDNALITYLATLVPTFSASAKIAVVAGAVTGGGLTVIANAPNPAGQALLGRFFDSAISPVGLFAGALLPTLIAATVFHFVP